MQKKRILSGIAPSGNLHIGNYLGALKQWVDLQKDYTVFAMVADLHAITVPQDPKTLQEKSLEVACLMIACGIDPKKSVIFLQSAVPAHLELYWILNTLTPVGELERMIQFKEKKEKSGVLAGLLNYPILMVSDILLYQSDLVPVGEDQLQHLELTRTLARKFNNRFGNTFKEPKPLVLKETARIMGLDDPTKKMSKSAVNPNNYIFLLDSPETIERKVKIAVTDSGKEVKYNETAKPAISNLMAIYSAISGLSLPTIEKEFSGKNYGNFKHALAKLLIETLNPIQKKYYRLIRNKTSLRKILAAGSKKASTLAQKNLHIIKEKMGFVL